MPLERLRSNGYAFLVEVILWAHRLGYFKLKRSHSILRPALLTVQDVFFVSQREAALRVWQCVLNTGLHPVFRCQPVMDDGPGSAPATTANFHNL